MENKCPQCGAPLPSGVLAGLCPACLFKQGASADTAVQPAVGQFQPPGVEEIVRLFPQLEILALIGKGGMGAVYRARQPALDRIVALKILPPQVAGGPNFVERFNREARALAKLNHPNIVAVYEFGQAGGLSYFIMEYVDGVNLRELERAGKLSPREALQIVPQICEALQFAHDEGIVHRDIKPENILLDKKGRVKIADFGIAKILGGPGGMDLTGTQAAIGTPHYMAPEQMEKPTAVDHRADIFSLGVVFYEMLTGELPLGKFAPPSTRKVKVDVRLDDVVLRALEKDPELRYQQASQVKTAVDTITGSAAPPPRATGAVIAQEILARDYTLSIRSCLRRGWKLLMGEFWPLVGITALVMALYAFASSFGAITIAHGPMRDDTTEFSSLFAILVGGPLWGGLWFYYLKKIRRESATVETAFSGFSSRWFLHLFLAGFVTSVLNWLGFLCLIIPGIYLAIAWMFPLQLVVDKQLDFWSAMELSRKVVTKHWFKFLGLAIVLLLLLFAGVLACIVGIFVTTPLVMATLMYAYEDIFGGVPAAATTPVGTGPGGTVVMPAVAASPVRTEGGNGAAATRIGLAAVVLVIIGMIAFMAIRHHYRQIYQAPGPAEFAEPVAPEPAVQPVASVEPVEPVNALSTGVFGPVTERTLTNFAAINFVSDTQTSLPPSVTEMSRGPEKDSAAGDWMESAGADLAFVSAYDGFYGMMRDMATLSRDSWEQATPASVAAALHDSGRDVAAKFGDASRLNNPTNYTYCFKTRDGILGLLQVIGVSENPPGVRIRAKLFQAATNQNPAAPGTNSKNTRATLSSRLEAASDITNVTAKDQALTAIAMDAAKAGEVGIVRQAVGQMFNMTARDSALSQAALLLAKHGLREQAIDLAKDINNFTERDRTLSELAQ